jgi:hypothetical protein
MYGGSTPTILPILCNRATQYSVLGCRRAWVRARLAPRRGFDPLIAGADFLLASPLAVIGHIGHEYKQYEYTYV